MISPLNDGISEISMIEPRGIEVINNGLTALEWKVVRAARTSFTNPQPRELEKDVKLLNYLYQNEHHTPFEMVDFVFAVTAPIFVARQWFRHRTMSYNEQSGRYVEFDELYYLPQKLRTQSADKKQGSDGFLDDDLNEKNLALIEAHSKNAFDLYKILISDGVAREQARIVLPLSLYTNFIVKANLRNWVHFIKLRTDDKAQEEIRLYANYIAKSIQFYFPHLVL